jgi:hypothetical protein
MPFARATRSCAASITFETPCRSSNVAIYRTSSFVSLAVSDPRGSVASPYSSARANAGRSNWWATAIRMSEHTSSFSESPGACAMRSIPASNIITICVINSDNVPCFLGGSWSRRRGPSDAP